MRGLIGLIVTALTAALLGCASGGGAASGSRPAATDAAGGSAIGACVMRSAGRDVLRLSLGANDRCTPGEGVLALESHERDAVHVWTVPGARTVEDGVARAGAVITGEFKDFKITRTAGLTVAGGAATRLSGTGTEADDGDPGTADVVVFRAGDRVFVACTHGESLAASASRWMLDVVQTARVP